MAVVECNYALNGVKIGYKDAVKVIGRKTFLSAIGRAAFHATASREDIKGNKVTFDLRKWWR